MYGQTKLTNLQAKDAATLAYAMVANNLLPSSDLCALVLKDAAVRVSNDAMIYYRPELTENEKETAADKALESLKALGPIGLIGIEYLRCSGVEFQRGAAGAPVMITDQTIFGGGAQQGGAAGPSPSRLGHSPSRSTTSARGPALPSKAGHRSATGLHWSSGAKHMYRTAAAKWETKWEVLLTFVPLSR